MVVSFQKGQNVIAGRSRAIHQRLTGASLTGGYITRSNWEILQDVNIIGADRMNVDAEASLQQAALQNKNLFHKRATE